MPSNYTSNYQLSQWLRDDRVLMEDFNADNAKLDAALKAQADALAAETAARTAADSAETAARKALAAELRPKAGAQLIASYTLPSQLSAAYTFPANIDWDNWLAVFITVELLVSGGTYSDLNFHFNDIRVMPLRLNIDFSPAAERIADTLMVTPFFDKRNWVRVWQMTSTNSGSISAWQNLKFEDITTFKISSGADIAAGTSYKIWGVR